MFRFGSGLAVIALTVISAAPAQTIAPTPPLGWNSWDAYGLTISEADYRANTAVLAGLHNYGWDYSVIDEGLYMQDPFANTLALGTYPSDEQRSLIPDPARFP